jgi:hypothetical protein
MEVGVLASSPLFIQINIVDYGEFGFQEGCPVLRAARLKKGYGP